MSKHTIKGFVTYRNPHSWEDGPQIDFKTYDPRLYSHDKETAVVSEHSIEVEVPDDFDPRPQMVAALEQEKQKVRAEFAAKITKIEAEISKLLSLEMAEA